MYAKIFNQIYDSSIVEDPELRFTFMDLLVLADMNGVVDMTHEAISRRTNRPITIIRSTILTLESPDPRSRTPDSQGRRLKRLDDHRDWGWMILNYDRFRKIASEEQRREKTLARVNKHRENTKKKGSVTHCNAPVTLVNASNAMQKQKQMQKEKNKKEPASQATPSSVESETEHQKFMRLWKVAYELKFKRRYGGFGAQAGKVVKQLLNEPGATAEDLMDVVNRAWALAIKEPAWGYWCSRLVKIPDLQTHWDDIQHELNDPKPQPKAEKKHFTGF